MPDFVDGQTQTYPITAGNTLFAWALCKIVAGSLVLCGAGDTPDGHVDPDWDGNTSYAPLVRRPLTGWPLGRADAAITSGVPVYAGASGTISATATGPCLGVALEAATALNDEIKYLPRTNGHESFRIVAAGTALTASSTETSLGSHSIPANRLRAGTRVRVRAMVKATATNSTDTLTVKLYIGGITGTLVASTGALDVADNDLAIVDMELVVRTSGATGTIVGAGMKSIGPAASATLKPAILDSTTIDTTAAQVVAVSGQWSTTSGSNSCRLDVLSVDIID